MSRKIYLKYLRENTVEFCLALKTAKNTQYLIFRYTKCIGYSRGKIINYETKILNKKVRGTKRAAEFYPTD
jgi:hypothetical protein